jgi:hypothetical protein
MPLIQVKPIEDAFTAAVVAHFAVRANLTGISSHNPRLRPDVLFRQRSFDERQALGHFDGRFS